MSYLDKLLDGVEVEWKALGNGNFFEVANKGRKPVKASLRVLGKTPYYGANNIQDYVDGYTHDGEFVLIAEDGTASLENYSVQYTTGKFWANNHVHVVCGKVAVNTRFLYHYLTTVNFIPFLSGGGRAKLTKGKMVDIPIPIPCPENPKKSLEIQAEIVRILDTFTELTTELTTELNARKKQYNYYRDQLLTFKEGKVEWKALGEIIKLQRGKRLVKKQLEKSGNYAVFQNSMTPLGYYHENNVKSDTTFIISAGAAGEIGFSNVDFWAADDVYFFLTPNNIESKFLYYFLLTQQYKILAQVRRASIPRLSKQVIEKLQFPIPSIAKQKEIVSILDKFDALTNSLTEGLPHEIELRQKQYAYYRDLLLNFPMAEEIK